MVTGLCVQVGMDGRGGGGGGGGGGIYVHVCVHNALQPHSKAGVGRA